MKVDMEAMVTKVRDELQHSRMPDKDNGVMERAVVAKS